MADRSLAALMEEPMGDWSGPDGQRRTDVPDGARHYDDRDFTDGGTRSRTAMAVLSVVNARWGSDAMRFDPHQLRDAEGKWSKVPGAGIVSELQEWTDQADDFKFNPNQPRDARGRWTKGAGGLLSDLPDVSAATRRRRASKLVSPSPRRRGHNTSYTVGGRKRQWTPEQARAVADSLEASADGKSSPAAIEGRTVSERGRRRALERVHAFPTRDDKVILDVGADSGKEGTGEQELTKEQARDLAALLRHNADRDEKDASRGSGERQRRKEAAPKAEEAPAPAPEQPKAPDTTAPPMPKLSAADALLRTDDEDATLSRETKKKLADVFTITHGGLTTEPSVRAFGDPDEPRTFISGNITDADGNNVGYFERVLQVGDNGELEVKHERLALKEEVQGQGFAQAFNRRAQDWYEQSGVTAIRLNANIDVGGYAWARQGYDWADRESAQEIAHRLKNVISKRDPAIPEDRWEEQVRQAKEMVDRLSGRFGGPFYPTPYEVAQLGRWDGAGRGDTWIGKAALLGSDWDAVKKL